MAKLPSSMQDGGWRGGRKGEGRIHCCLSSCVPTANKEQRGKRSPVPGWMAKPYQQNTWLLEEDPAPQWLHGLSQPPNPDSKRQLPEEPSFTPVWSWIFHPAGTLLPENPFSRDRHTVTYRSPGLERCPSAPQNTHIHAQESTWHTGHPRGLSPGVCSKDPRCHGSLD